MTAPKMVRKEVVSAEQIRAAIRERFPADQYALMEEVRNATGFAASRSADALVLGLWPSRGMLLTGIEIKCYRSDWLRELNDPGKAEPIARYCDEWYIAAPDTSVVKVEEVPPNWGLFVLDKRSGLRAVREAVPNANPHPLDKPFIAAMLRRAQKTGAAQGAIDAAVREEKKRAKALYEQSAARLKQDHESLVARIRAFEEASGVSLMHEWNMPAIGETVRAVMANKHSNAKSAMLRVVSQIRSIADMVEREMERDPA